MKLLINGRPATLKTNSSFDYVSENRAFSDADDYSLSITLPLAGCPDNRAIFGHIDRMDSDSRQMVLDATIVDNALSRNGVITVVEANEVEIKCQFLEGRSVQNFLTTFDDRYINELPLGSYPSASLHDPVSFGDIDHNVDCVALPWVNDSSSGFINNEVVVVDGVYQWADSTKNIGKLSFMPYLITIAKRICEAVGYTCDFSEWEKSDERFLLICNALPASWDLPQFARALPHWTVSEFFAELEKILVCEINIDHRAQHIDLTFCNDICTTRPEIKIDEVLDSFNSEVAYEDDLCHFKGVANLRYADRGDNTWKVDQCQWLVDMMKADGKYYREFASEEDFLWWRMANVGYCTKDAERGASAGQLIHTLFDDKYYLIKVVPAIRYFADGSSRATYRCAPQMVNRFGDVVRQPDSDNEIELSMLPVRIDETDAAHGRCIFLAPAGFDEDEEVDSDGIRQPMAYTALMKGEPDSVAEYYDKIFLAYWDGHSSNQEEDPGVVLPPAPEVDVRFNLRRRYESYLAGLTVNPREKMKISWISTRIPDVRSIFHIKGKRYLCEKITATFTENGMSQLLKGEFYPLND